MINQVIPPAFNYPGVCYWERSSDPWHPDAFPEEFKHAAPHQTEQRATGWMAIDHAENAIGFIQDGSDYPAAEEFELREGMYKRTCAYPPTT